MPHHRFTEAQIARMLAEIPGLETWENRPLPGDLWMHLRDLDQQQLMSVAVECLLRASRSNGSDDD